MTYRFPNIGRQREAERLAAQIAILPGEQQNREARRSGGLIVRCAQGAVLCRVFKFSGGLLFVPAGSTIRGSALTGDRRAGTAQSEPAWRTAAPYWIDADRSDEVRARCRCCADTATFTTADMLDHIRRDKPVMRLPGPPPVR